MTEIVTISSIATMILEQSSEASRQDALDPKRAMPVQTHHLVAWLHDKRFSIQCDSYHYTYFERTLFQCQICPFAPFQFDEAATSFIASGWLYGSIIGILLFGFIGDVLGYYKGMIMATTLTFVGMISGKYKHMMYYLQSVFVMGLIFLDSFSFWCFEDYFGYWVWRKYSNCLHSNLCSSKHHQSIPPLDTQEVSSTGSILLLLQSSSWVCFHLSPHSQLLGPVLFNLCLKAFPNALQSVLQGILLVASLPSLISLILLCYSYQRVVYLPLVDVEEAATESKAEPTLPVWRAFIATGVTWFLYDFNVTLYVRNDSQSYGNTFSSKEIVRSMVPIPDSPAGVTIPLILAGLFGVPGQLVVHSLFRHFDVRSVQRIVRIMITINHRDLVFFPSCSCW